MKNIIGFTVAAVIMTASLLIGCGERAEKHVGEATENMVEANKELKEAAKEASEEAKTKVTTNWQKFKIESDSTITSMKENVTGLREKIAKANKREREKYTTNLNVLEQKLDTQIEKLKQRNVEFAENLKKFDETIITVNESFIREFNHDLAELGIAITNFFKNDIK